MTKRWNAADATQELLAVLPLIMRIVAGAVKHEAGADLTMPQYRVLALLAEDAQTATTLAKRRRVSLPTMGALVQALVERGFVSRIPDPRDRRQQLLELTEIGRDRYQRAEVRAIRQLQPLLATLSDEELLAVETALPALHRALTNDEEQVIDGDAASD
ncbi:MAG TPA: MarR family transcriptional regulator [Roseiflexaceae bacterium]|nr:MarR family transcriptional regulator [Roseiflexaceae bacterium]